MTNLYRVAGAFAVLSVTALMATGCMGPTYGTGKGANEQLIDDISGSFSLAPAKKVDLAYQPRGQLVKPSTPGVLVPPEKSLASRDNPQWVESPEEARTRLRAEADANKDNSTYRSPLARSVTDGKVMSPEQQRLAFREARKIENGAYSDRRRFMSDPPLEYRKADPAALTDLGKPESDKEKERKKEAEIAGSGKKWWQVFD